MCTYQKNRHELGDFSFLTVRRTILQRSGLTEALAWVLQHSGQCVALLAVVAALVRLLALSLNG